MSLTEKQAIKIGGVFQITMIAAFIFFTVKHGLAPGASFLSPTSIPSHLGALLFGYCLLVLYFSKKRTQKLITTGPFKYTRHPMYTGLLLMDTIYWLPQPPAETTFFFAQALFVVCLVIAAYFQEQETLARFGKEAEEYYAKTPRLFLFYPLLRR